MNKYYTFRLLICIFFSLTITACNDNQNPQIVKQKITPNVAEQVNVNYITAGLKQKGFICNSFINGINQPMITCSRLKGSGLDACADSIWIEHDGQNHILTNQQFYECDNERKMVITRKIN